MPLPWVFLSVYAELLRRRKTSKLSFQSPRVTGFWSPIDLNAYEMQPSPREFLDHFDQLGHPIYILSPDVQSRITSRHYSRQPRYHSSKSQSIEDSGSKCALRSHSTHRSNVVDQRFTRAEMMTVTSPRQLSHRIGARLGWEIGRRP